MVFRKTSRLRKEPNLPEYQKDAMDEFFEDIKFLTSFIGISILKQLRLINYPFSILSVEAQMQKVCMMEMALLYCEEYIIQRYCKLLPYPSKDGK